MAEFAVGSLEIALGRYDDALRHLGAARDLAERSGGDWLLAASPVQLGILAVLRGRLDEARALLEERAGPEPGGPQHPVVTLCLAAAPAGAGGGGPERAARLEGRGRGPAPARSACQASAGSRRLEGRQNW